MNELLLDPWVVAEIDRALAPYVGRLSAAHLAWMREHLAETLCGDRGAADLLSRARPRTNVDESGEQTRGVGASSSAAPRRPGKVG